MRRNGGSKYRWAMRAYPAEYRDSVGDELVDTANALGGKPQMPWAGSAGQPANP